MPERRARRFQPSGAPGASRWRWAATLLSLAVGLVGNSSTSAQQVTAVAGQPYGVAEFRWPVGDEVPTARIHNRGWALHSPDGRTLYPVVRPLLREDGLLADVLGLPSERPRILVVTFLFEGDRPFDIVWDFGVPQTLHVQPRPPRRREYDRLLGRWWRDWQDAADLTATPGDRVLGEYMTYLAARDTGLAPGKLLERLASENETLRTLQLVSGSEQIRSQVRLATLLGENDRRQAADQVLPAPAVWQPLDIEARPPPALESIAQQVPPECFYIRFGSFPNYLWFNRLLTDNGGDLATLVSPVAVRRPLSERFQQQIGLKQSALAEVLGPAVIADVALLGYDLYTGDGAAMGILFQARNALLGNDLMNQRRAALASQAGEGATEQTVTIAGRDVSLIATPDNRLRSFYAVQGDFHLVTTSRHLVQRFLEVASGEASLASLLEFQEARRRLPLEREDTLFLYFSTPFFQNLVSPQYQIELERRLRAATDMQLLALAAQVAQSRGLPAESTFDLIELGLLPAEVLARPEGGEIVMSGPRPVDTLRGARGTFLPIPDVELTGATLAEVRSYLRRAEYYAANVKQFDPLMVAIQRTALNGEGLERIAIEARISPLDETKYGRWLSLLGPPTTQHVTAAPGDIIAVQAHVQGGLFSAAIPPHILFVGIQDLPPAASAGPGLLQLLQLLRTTPGYLGAWPKTGFLDWLPLGLGGGPPDALGFSALPLGLWRRQWADFSVLSFQRPVLEAATPHLQPVEARDPAQLRVYVGDLSQSQLAPLLNELSGEQALELTAANARLLHRLDQWLGIERSAARQVAETLLDAELASPLGGGYVLVEPPGATAFWAAEPQVAEQPPLAGYQSPVLAWYRGLNADVARTAEGLLLRAELDMQRAASEPKVELPLFNFFKPQRPSAAPPEAQQPTTGQREF